MISFDINMIAVIKAIKSDGRINSANSATTSYLPSQDKVTRLQRFHKLDKT
jgi:hypothetical protein